MAKETVFTDDDGNELRCSGDKEKIALAKNDVQELIIALQNLEQKME